MPALVVNSLTGPNGPVRYITTNGNHRTAALQALNVPVVLAEIDFIQPPYRSYVPHSGDEFNTVIAFLRWLDAKGAIRLSAGPIGRGHLSGVFRVADTPAPWLLGHPADAILALNIYETITGRPLKEIGGMHTAELRAEWRHVPKPEPVDDVTILSPSAT
jgi:hypothetical protein